jgi:hypothetical protein
VVADSVTAADPFTGSGAVPTTGEMLTVSALLLVQVSVTVPPVKMVVGLAARVTVGSGVAETVTVAVAVAVPPAPVAVIV